ncbi:hypothetical protein INT47_009144 [Mucor saturninus]|uniref:UDP-glycosyltransferases domain-containing protein n=1 Tax=Mucor saturninus TaxID=64648 RepID=A0A8H7VAN7_9FUNG|nr:hypothetical protein INT47_009144 [Mucor saturninus]
MKLLGLASLFVATVLGTSTFEISPNFRSPKNILFSCMYGGSSHVSWVISILDELSLRGHTTFYLTTDGQIKFAKDYPSITSNSIGPSLSKEEHDRFMEELSSKPIVEGIKSMLERLTIKFPHEYVSNLEYIKSNNIDLVICDSFNSPCIEAAIKSKIPFLATSSFAQGKDASAPYINNDLSNMKNPTTEFMSLKERISDMIINPVKYTIMLYTTINSQKKMYKKFGIKPALQAYRKSKDSVKLVNSAFGFEQGRPLGPLMELVGPILPKTYQELTPELKSYLDAHRRVAYVAFGQHAIGKESDGRLVLTGLLEAIERNDLDGVIWATRGIDRMFPSHITTESNTTYDVKTFYEGTEKVMFINWAPQMAILHHPATSMFITHGGAGSLYESFYSGVRVIVYPFFMDQPGAAKTMEKNGVGLMLERHVSQTEANKIIQKVALDEGGKFQLNTERFKALVQIRSQCGVARSADIIEEVLFTHNGTHVPHRWDVKRNMTFIKASNLDIYMFLVVFLGCFGYGIKSLFTVPKKLKTI